jgi:hypothetical protein
MTTPPPKTHGTGEYISFLEQRVAELEAKVEAGYYLARWLNARPRIYLGAVGRSMVKDVLGNQDEQNQKEKSL